MGPKPREREVTSRIMSAVKAKDTRVEVALRRALFAQGLRFRKHATWLPGKPDIVFTKQKLAVFVDGDFWHGNAWRIRGYPSLEAMFAPEKRDFWVPKIQRNIERDNEVNRQLESLGWKTLRLWESDVKSNLDECVNRVRKALS